MRVELRTAGLNGTAVIAAIGLLRFRRRRADTTTLSRTLPVAGGWWR